MFRGLISESDDFPKAGVRFYDIAPLLSAPDIWSAACDRLSRDTKGVNKIVAIESKGFLLGAALQERLSLPLVLARKPGLTPGELIRREFKKEYGEAVYEMRAGAVKRGEKVLLCYDILAGAGASLAVSEMVSEMGGEMLKARYLIELEWLGGREQLTERGCEPVSLIRYKSPGSVGIEM